MTWLKRSIAFTLIKWGIRWQFPFVPRLGTADLAHWLADTTRPDPYILDVRAEAEYAVSHLQSAQLLAQNPLEINCEPLSSLPKDQPIVVYCSVGYRSARAAQQLQQLGFTHVFNLEGSLFQWANEARPLFHNGEPTQEVHPYNESWGKLLKRTQQVRDAV